MTTNQIALIFGPALYDGSWVIDIIDTDGARQSYVYEDSKSAYEAWEFMKKEKNDGQ